MKALALALALLILLIQYPLWLGKGSWFRVRQIDQQIQAQRDVNRRLKERNLATPKLPERLEIVDALPMTATGKIQKHVLRDDVVAKLRG